MAVFNIAGDALATFEMLTSTTTVRNLKWQVQHKCNIPCLQQKLILGCSTLDDNVVLASLPQPVTVTLVRVAGARAMYCCELDAAWIEAQRRQHWNIDAWRLELVELLSGGRVRQLHRAVLDGCIEVVARELRTHSRMMGSDLERESARLRKLSHQNLVHVLGVFQAKPFYVVTELCTGGSCFSLLHRSSETNLERHQELKICSDAADAMAYLHGLRPPIIHGELTTGKMLLTLPVSSGRDIPLVKVSDAGFLRMLRPDNWAACSLQSKAVSKAPEVLTGRCCYDEKIDVYSYAMVIFEVICCEIPFELEENLAITRLTLQGARPDLAAVPDDCPQLLYDIMVTSWAQSAKQRPNFRQIVPWLQELTVRPGA